MVASPTNVQVITPADWVPGPNQGDWTYEEYITLPDDGKQYEIANGVLLVTPSLTGSHRDTIGEVSYYLRTHVKLAGLGVVIQAPFSVELSAKDVFQPDIFVVMNAHRDRVQEKRIVGAPDLVVEVSDSSTAAFDRLTKYDTYEYTGVLEYWILNLERRTVEVFVLDGDEYHSLGVFNGEQKVLSRMISWLSVRVDQFFL
ncbi:MAG TPA: Uma2 family endonuclease [Ktedonobacteraceae bacterium]|nr:Uma2 family endonuclease [Ktedonobacteraceae bacterium]